MGDQVGLVNRILSRVKRNERGCLEWQGETRGGYGRISVGNRKFTVHRVAWELWHGPIPESLTIDHRCRNRRCVNPAHMEPVTMLENIRRAESGVSKINREKTHCSRGHEFSHVRQGKRKCRTCENITLRAWRAARRDAAVREADQ